MESCSFTNCAAFLQGGGIYTSGDATVSNSEFIGNSAQSGGAIYATNSLVVEGSTFADNSAENGPDIGGSAEVSGCRNTGIEDPAVCDTTEDTSSSTWLISSSTLALAALYLL